MRTSGWEEGKWGRSREAPPHRTDREEACDQRSVPQDVTSSWSVAEGSICSKRSSLTRPKDLLATPLLRLLPLRWRERNGTYNLTGHANNVSPDSAPTPA